ncbi:MarR family winged helix-turn-helix transcriptional regulator [Clostridium aminobutyricum]|uniref:Winged helix-turn-helix transcriptional regulator n=1 Tax=Clostridium aminobutyricum TaxID=33953 RepID=A0A939D9A6_CLOAM|nr:MarR family winged helix-turn-helix transcriptional regulator [Clostridium aminobutyricum]MBN7773490.1 winged helix-turn-helix transcriptional regulator [Clostridium aminobutyricum]
MVKESIGKYIAAIHRNVQSIMNYKLEQIDINNGQYDFFFVISNHEGLSQKELSERLHIGKSTTAKAVKNLVNSGYITREQDEYDRRYYRLYLTEKGKQIVPIVRSTFLELIEIYSKDLSPKEYEETINVLKRILNNVSNEKNKLNSDIE